MKNFNKKGCLKTLGIVLFLAAFITIVCVSALRNTTILGIDAEKFELYLQELNKPINEKDIAPNPVTLEDLENLKAKFKDNNLNVIYGNEIVIDRTSYNISNTFNITANEFSAFANLSLNPNYSKYLKVLQTTVRETQKKDEFIIATVTELNLTELKKQIAAIKNFPNIIYLTTTSNVSVLDGKIKIFSSEININKLKNSLTQELTKLFNNIFNAANMKVDINKLLNVQYLEQLNKVQKLSNFNLALSSGKINFNKMTSGTPEV